MNNKATKGMSTANVTGKAAGPKATPPVKGSVAAAKAAGVNARMPAISNYEDESNHRTLMEAEHIKADPAKMMKVRQVAGRKLMAATAIHNIADIKTAAKKLRAGKLAAPGANPTEPGKRFPSGEMDPDAMDHHATLERAEMIKASPSKMAGVAKIAAAKAHAAKSVHKMVEGSAKEEKGESAAYEKKEDA